MKCCLMLLRMVNRILDWLGRRVGCWIDASEFFSFLCVMLSSTKMGFVLYRFWESVSEISAQ